ncbi:hypothetical protein [Frankia sp. CiP1_Cm_nod1]|uniref:hypothetical protein n=1 Tax=Frankia sp. CiP1_Cm_nod1 TaxID=2897160 RepID=UPI0020250A57
MSKPARLHGGRMFMAVLSMIAVFLLVGAPSCARPAPRPSESAPPSRGATNPGQETGNSCAQPGSTTRSLLPDLPDDQIRTVAEDPCLKFSQLTDRVLAAVPAGQRSILRNGTTPFLPALTQFANRVIAVNGAAECAYKTDRLAIGIYQHKNYLWSVGVVAVVRGKLPATVLDVGTCLLLEKIAPARPAFLTPNGATEIEPTVCADYATTSRDGQNYTLMWLGSSDRMCDQLASKLDGS